MYMTNTVQRALQLNIYTEYRGERGAQFLPWIVFLLIVLLLFWNWYKHYGIFGIPVGMKFKSWSQSFERCQTAARQMQRCDKKTKHLALRSRAGSNISVLFCFVLFFRYSISGVFLSAVHWAILCGAWQHPVILLPVPQGQDRHRRLLALLAGLDRAAADGLEQVCAEPTTRLLWH